MKYDLKAFGERLKYLIENTYRTQKEIAKIAKIDKNNLSLYCAGKKALSQKTLIKLCVALDCSPDWLMKGEGSKDDKFNFANIEARKFKRLEARRIDEMVEIKFFIPQQEFKTFCMEAQREGCML